MKSPKENQHTSEYKKIFSSQKHAENMLPTFYSMLQHLASSRKTYFNFLIALNGAYFTIIFTSEVTISSDTIKVIVILFAVSLVYVINHAISSAISSESRVINGYEHMIFELQELAFHNEPNIVYYTNIRNFLTPESNIGTKPLVNSLQSIIPIFRFSHVFLCAYYSFLLFQKTKLTEPSVMMSIAFSLILFAHSVYHIFREKVNHKLAKKHIDAQPNIFKIKDGTSDDLSD